MRHRRELEEEKAPLELTVERKVQESLSGLKATAKEESEDECRLVVNDRDRKIQAMTRQIEDLGRKANASCLRSLLELRVRV